MSGGEILEEKARWAARRTEGVGPSAAEKNMSVEPTRTKRSSREEPFHLKNQPQHESGPLGSSLAAEPDSHQPGAVHVRGFAAREDNASTSSSEEEQQQSPLPPAENTMVEDATTKEPPVLVAKLVTRQESEIVRRRVRKELINEAVHAQVLPDEEPVDERRFENFHLLSRV